VVATPLYSKGLISHLVVWVATLLWQKVSAVDSTGVVATADWLITKRGDLSPRAYARVRLPSVPLQQSLTTEWPRTDQTRCILSDSIRCRCLSSLACCRFEMMRKMAMMMMMILMLAPIAQLTITPMSTSLLFVSSKHTMMIVLLYINIYSSNDNSEKN